jgi:hypothetical protein
MTRINSGLLSDTLNLVQLARETALAKGKQAQAERLSPVVDELKTLATVKRDVLAAGPSSVMAQSDFRTLLAASGNSPTQPLQQAQSTQSPLSVGGSERNRMVLAMAAGNMREMDIARQLGMAQDEVRMVISASQKARVGVEVKK